MAHPKRQHSKQRGRKRRTHQKGEIHFGSLSIAGNPAGYNHGVDPITGMYKGKQVIDVVSRNPKNAEES